MPAATVLYTWLFLRSQGSALLAAVLHASSNLWTPDAVPTGTATQLTLVLGLKWTLVAVALATGLTPRDKPTAKVHQVLDPAHGR